MYFQTAQVSTDPPKAPSMVHTTDKGTSTDHIAEIATTMKHAANKATHPGRTGTFTTSTSTTTATRSRTTSISIFPINQYIYDVNVKY